MPRDLFSSSSSDSPSPKELSLVASPESQTPTFSAIAKGFDHGDSDDPQLEGEGPGWENEDGSSGGRTHFLIHHDDSMKGTAMQLLRGKGAQQANRADELHPLVQTLGLKDLESCLALEHACFEEHERASREKVRGQSVLGDVLFLHHCPSKYLPSSLFSTLSFISRKLKLYRSTGSIFRVHACTYLSSFNPQNVSPLVVSFPPRPAP